MSTTPDSPSWHPATQAVRAGLARSEFDETSEALFLTSGYVFSSAQDAADTFAGDLVHDVYSRYTNPTVRMFEERLASLEGAEACAATSSGMAAIFCSLAALLENGDRVVASRSMFGAIIYVVNEFFPRWGVETVLVDPTDLDAWAEALSVPTKAVLFESPSNPLLAMVDIEEVSALAHAAGATVIVDNVFATPVFSKPLQQGADVVVYSATKHIDGQGRVLGGAVLGRSDYVAEIVTLLRNLGPTLSAFNAWVLLKGLETLDLRVRRMAENAEAVARFLESHPKVATTIYPTLDSFPQKELADKQLTGGGTVVAIKLEGGQDEAFRFMDALEIFDISNNLGDAKSLVTHPATTTHRRIGPEGRAAAGITDGTVRFSVGLEDARDLVADLEQALARL
ncbi:O-succinylhomoserine sulfhydrylase [Nocardioides jishulii]|uniref:O-succinylhomoserine sulfhydrylase n=1 Tax=Nocardioides jishulii TaxID=2575440 RepID=A0A4U2YK86_9ACTN|nr:O-succinylhomoserine sulfhydrylase [Nocardioides jishulii]QCX27077.1 O-succinylhomoserine sulfhydrylase [Nocardioides jishulii]TKI61559.1 O-succinylhomoserine sulfhydrylase [Nocardioides jishulii]